MTTKPGTWNYIAGLSKAANLWERLHSLWVFDDTGYMFEVVSGQLMIPSSNGVEIPTTEGTFFRPSGTQSFTLNRPIPRSDIDANGISMFVRGIYPSTQSNFRQMISLVSTASSGNSQYITLRTAGTGSMSIRRRINEAFNAEQTATRVNDTPWSGIISHDGNVTGEISINGERFTRIGGTDATVSYELDQIQFGQQFAGISIVAIWNRQLSAAEFDQLEADPYCMITPDPMLGVPLAALMPTILGGGHLLTRPTTRNIATNLTRPIVWSSTDFT